MINIILMVIVTVISAIIYYPILKKVISEDDGNWYYLAVFRKFKIFKELKIDHPWINDGGFFNLPSIFLLIFKLFGRSDAEFSKIIKYAWYICTSLAIFLLTNYLWGNLYIGFIASLIHILLVSQPNTFSDLTYAEYFVVLPLIILLACYLQGIKYDLFYLIILSGFLTGIIYQIKQIYLFVLVLPFIIHNCLISDFALFITGFLICLLLPALIIQIFSKAKKEKLDRYIRINFYYYITVFNLIKSRFIKKENTKKLEECNYIEKNWNKYDNHKSDLNSLFERYLVTQETTLIFSYISLISLFFINDIFIILGWFLLLGSLFMIYMQKNYYNPKYGSLYFPISILSAYTIYHALQSSKIITILLIFSLLLYCCWKAIKLSLNRLKKKNLTLISSFDKKNQALFDICPVIAKYIKERTCESDYIYLYGNHAAIYLLSQRRCPSPIDIFSFPNQKQNLINLKFFLTWWFSKNLPVYFLNMNFSCKNAWTPNEVFDYVGINYKKEKNFTIYDDNGYIMQMFKGLPFSFDLFRLDDELYILNSIERIRLGNSTKEDKLLKINELLIKYKDNKELLSYLKILQSDEALDNQDNALINEILQIEEYINNQDLIKAENLILNQIQEERSTSYTWLQLGEISFINNDLNSAYGLFMKSYELNPYSITLLNNMAVLAFINQDLKLANLLIDSALRYCPGYQDAIANQENIKKSSIQDESK